MGAPTRCVIARSDQGGLGYQTRDAVDMLRPQLVIEVVMGDAARGNEHPGMFDGKADEVWRVNGPHITDDEWHAIGKAGIDWVWTAETFYSSTACKVLRSHNVRTAVHANPELFVDQGADLVAVPSSWQVATVEARHGERCYIMPHHYPDVPATPRTHMRRLLALDSPAMLDRNGLLVAIEAFKLQGTVPEIIVHAPGANIESVDGVKHSAEHVEDMGSIYDEVDALLLPRRYGGLCLPHMEAAARGIVTIAPDTPPHDRWAGTILGPESKSTAYRPMKGGNMPVHTFDPVDFAAAIMNTSRTEFAHKSLEAISAAEAWRLDDARVAWDELLV